MLPLCHALAVAAVQVFILSENWALGKNINFYNVRPPLDHTQYCLTVHHFTSPGRSTSITKKCASRSECHFVGCHRSRDSEHTECRSCCEGMICNVELPTNHTNAVFAVMHAQRTSGSGAPTPSLPALAWVSVLLLMQSHCS
ncbi:ly6/PLAUR domain-containing protein 6B isoform X2 [Lontra canadensis]|uniref:ly6/PLAUR domain-containing protein 6B isoform X2 n=1 Tax=Lontra canadensis TaxID=76717 RepID=UPI0013F39051|nr:ly6/PLAUR domain-containing protein 6B isoform X2 [Lontra canadensis]